MATAGATGSEPTEGNTRFLRWMLLLVEGGSMVLRELFDKTHPPLQLPQALTYNKAQLIILKKRGVLRDDQYDLLFPQQGSPDSSTFDITLLTCLLRNICGLNQGSPVWTNPPSQTDFSTEADIARLRSFRNECAHSTQPSMSAQAFQQTWTDLEQVLLRLGAGIPDLQDKIDAFQTRTIDPARERELKSVIQTWESLDDKLQKDLEEVKSEVQSQSLAIHGLSSQVEELADSVATLSANDEHNFEEREQMKADIKRVTTEAPKFRKNINDLKKKSRKHGKAIKRSSAAHLRQLNEISKALHELKKETSPEMDALVEHTTTFLEDIQSDCPYVETEFHQKAKDSLLKHSILVLSGHPGEGKTTMAAKLMLEISTPDKCLKLREPADWKFFDLHKEQINIVFADDVFGPGSMDQQLVKEWEKFLPDMCKAAQKQRVKIIFTTRHSVLGDAKDVLHSPVFDDKHVIHLSSKELSEIEKVQILEKHLRVANRHFQDFFIAECISASETGFGAESAIHSSGVVFGFPQCVTMFAQNDDIFNRKSGFFSKPEELFRGYIEEIFKNEKKFLALLLIWSQPQKRICLSDLDLSSTSHELKHIAEKFGYSLKPKLVKIVRNALHHHKDGLVVFNRRSGQYLFSHRVISDMIGLVVGKKYPEAILEMGDRHFVINYVTLDDKYRDFSHLYVEPYLYKTLGERLLRLFLNPRKQPFGNAFKRFKRYGKCSNTVTPVYQIDFGLIFIDALTNETFIADFVRVLEDQKFIELSKKLLSQPIMRMSGHFLGRGIYTDDIEVALPDYLLLHGRSLFLKQLIKSNTSMKVLAEKHDIALSLMIAVHSESRPFALFLLSHGAEVTDEIIYIAAMTGDTELLTQLLEKKGRTTVQKPRIVNENSALTASSKKGLVPSVKCLVEHGEDVKFKNKDNYNALGKAVIYNQLEVCKILVDAGSPLDTKVGKYKRTPLHIACDLGFTDIARLLLASGASPNIRDAKGHFPIHCAAFRNHIAVVKVFLEHDLTLAKQRITSYRKQSPVKGMSVFHVAVLKDFPDMIDMLVDMNADTNVTDYFGRTPLLYAVSLGKYILPLVRASDINKPNKQGLTPLHVALIRKDTQMAKRLLNSRRDINVNATDKNRRTPLHVAFQTKLIGIALEMIFSHRADVRMKMRNGATVFHILTKKCRSLDRYDVKDVELCIKEEFPDIEIQNGELNVGALFSLLKQVDPGHQQYTQGLRLETPPISSDELNHLELVRFIEMFKSFIS